MINDPKNREMVAFYGYAGKETFKDFKAKKG